MSKRGQVTFPFARIMERWPEYFESGQLVSKEFHDGKQGIPSNVPCLESFAECVGSSVVTIRQYASRGDAMLSADTADRMAVSLGSHPGAVWPDEWMRYLHQSLYRECRVCGIEKELTAENYSPRKDSENFRYDCRQCENAATQARRRAKRKAANVSQ